MYQLQPPSKNYVNIQLRKIMERGSRAAVAPGKHKDVRAGNAVKPLHT